MLISRLWCILGAAGCLFGALPAGFFVGSLVATSIDYIDYRSRGAEIGFTVGFLVFLALISLGIYLFSISGNVITRSEFSHYKTGKAKAIYKLVSVTTHDRWFSSTMDEVRNGSFRPELSDTYRVFCKDTSGKIFPKELAFADVSFYALDERHRVPQIRIYDAVYDRVRKFYKEERILGQYHKEHAVLYLPEDSFGEFVIH